MHPIKHYQDPTSGYTEKLKTFIEKGSDWEDSIQMQQSMTLEEAGWQVKVRWGRQTSDTGQDLGIGLIADQDLTAGRVIRICTVGKSLIIFNSTTNLPNLNNWKTAKYVQNYSFACECIVDAGVDALLLYVPGNSLNHSENGNTQATCYEEALHLAVTTDVKKGEPLFHDYRKFGRAPSWFLDKLRESIGDERTVFQGCNEYV